MAQSNLLNSVIMFILNKCLQVQYPEVKCYTDRHVKEKQGVGDCFTCPMQFLLYNIEQSKEKFLRNHKSFCKHVSIFPVSVITHVKSYH